MEIGYTHRDKNGRTPFNFDDPGKNNELTTTLDYTLDRYWKIGVNTVYDLDGKEYTDLDYSLTRNLHCFEGKLVWREKRRELAFSLDLIQF